MCGSPRVVIDQSYSGAFVEPLTIGATTVDRGARGHGVELKGGDVIAQLTIEKPITLSRPSRVTGKFDLARRGAGDERVDRDDRRRHGEVVGQDQGGDVDDVARRRDGEVDRVGRGDPTRGRVGR